MATHSKVHTFHLLYIDTYTVAPAVVCTYIQCRIDIFTAKKTSISSFNVLCFFKFISELMEPHTFTYGGVSRCHVTILKS